MPISLILTPFDHFQIRPTFAVTPNLILEPCLNPMVSKLDNGNKKREHKNIQSEKKFDKFIDDNVDNIHIIFDLAHVFKWFGLGTHC